VVNVLVQFALAALVASSDPGQDVVFLKDGEPLRGMVVEEVPGVSVTIQLPGGELRKLAAAEVQRIEYQETLPRAPAPAAAPAEPATAEQAPGWRRATPEPSTFMVALGFAAGFPVGDAAGGVAMSDLTGTQLVANMEGGFRFTPAWMASAFFEGGLGGTGSRSQASCHAAATPSRRWRRPPPGWRLAAPGSSPRSPPRAGPTTTGW
jgi:hypothetical protein